MPATADLELQRRDLTVRAFAVRADSWRDEDRSFEAVLATEEPVLVWDMQRWEPVLEVLRMDGCKLPASGQGPLLDTHDRSTIDKQLGSVRELRVDGGRLLGRNYVSSVELKAATKVKERHVTDCSIGYRVINYVTIEPGQTVEVAGKIYSAGAQQALRVTTAWEFKENSLCPIGADQGAKVRKEPAGEGVRLPARQKEGIMPEVTPAPAGAPATPPAAPAPAPAVREALKPELTSSEVLRRDVLGIAPPELEGFARGLLLQDGMTLDKARAMLREEYAKGKKEPAGSTEPGEGARAEGKDKAAKAPAKLADVSDDVLRRSIFGA